MLVFPQLSTGAAALYPFARTASTRTVVNRMADGRVVGYADPDWSRCEWELRVSAFTADEWEAVESLFVAVRGRLETFTFLDPAGNLLARSEEFDAAEWNNDALISLTPGIDDPLGGSAATRVVNSSGVASQEVRQVLAAPGWYRYSLSVWIRAGAGVLFGGAAEKPVVAGSEWTRVSMPVDLGSAAESVAFGIRLAAGGQMDLFGMQVEAQPGMSSYKKTGAQGGVFGSARFGGDELVGRAQATDVIESVIRVVS